MPRSTENTSVEQADTTEVQYLTWQDSWTRKATTKPAAATEDTSANALIYLFIVIMDYEYC